MLGLLGGCPQLLDDTFSVSPELPEVGLNGHGGSSPAGADAGAAVADPEGPVADPEGPVAGPEGPEVEPGVTELASLVAHRYDFDGSGSAVLDSVGSAHGTSIGALLDGSGRLLLSGNEQYVNLPDGLISGFESVSIECWINWAGSSGSYWGEEEEGTWQNLFTFGTSDQGVGQQGVGTRYIYLTPQPASYYGDNVRAGYSLTGFNTESFVSGERPLPISADTERGTQVVYVLDGARSQMSVFIDGELEVTSPSSQQIDLSEIPDVNNWLGRSQFLESPEFEGELLDVRIYGVPLSLSQVELSFDLGADAAL